MARGVIARSRKALGSICNQCSRRATDTRDRWQARSLPRSQPIGFPGWECPLGPGSDPKAGLRTFSGSELPDSLKSNENKKCLKETLKNPHIFFEIHYVSCCVEVLPISKNAGSNISHLRKRKIVRNSLLVRDMYPQKSKMTSGTSQENVDVIWSFLPLHCAPLNNKILAPGMVGNHHHIPSSDENHIAPLKCCWVTCPDLEN